MHFGGGKKLINKYLRVERLFVAIACIYGYTYVEKKASVEYNVKSIESGAKKVVEKKRVKREFQSIEKNRSFSVCAQNYYPRAKKLYFGLTV